MHQRPEISSTTTAVQYVEAAQKMHAAQYPRKGPPSLVRWIGDAAIAVFPIRRICCAIGLTSGLLLGSIAATILSGHDPLGAPVAKNKIASFLQPLHGKIKYDPKGIDAKNRWTGVALAGIYALGGFLGVKFGAWYSYRDVYEKNKNPQFIEDYMARVSQHHGDTWSWLAAFGGIFGSSSGNILLPIPGFNYGMSLAFSSIGTKDQNIMIPGFNRVLSGSTTTASFGVRDALNELCKYAVNNPAQNPVQLEAIAYTALGQMFGDKLKAEHIRQFVDKVHEVRDAYWQEGGIPKDAKKAAMQDMEAHFKGRGFEELLETIGLDPAKISFLHTKGIIGTMSNHLGTSRKVLHEQEEFRAKLAERRVERANAAGAEEEPEETRTVTYTPPGKKPVSFAAAPRYDSHTDRAAATADTLAHSI